MHQKNRLSLDSREMPHLIPSFYEICSESDRTHLLDNVHNPQA
jgi:hypothetical protein